MRTQTLPEHPLETIHPAGNTTQRSQTNTCASKCPQAAREMDPPPLECTLRAGELLFVPRGWWHAALNLEPCVAVTQNFVSPVTLPHAAAFLSDGRSDALVSGCSEESDCRALRGRFLAALRVRGARVFPACSCSDVFARVRGARAFVLRAYPGLIWRLQGHRPELAALNLETTPLEPQTLNPNVSAL